MQKVSYIFPGQGAQYVGMAKDLYDNSPQARNVFDKTEHILPQINVKKLCFEGPLEELTKTANSQLCILVTSLACLEALRPKVSCQHNIVALAGLSLGELTSLVAANVVSFEDAVRLVRIRGELMEEASIKNPGTMASILDIPLGVLKSICEETGAEIANLNCPGQIVISGRIDSVNEAMKLSLEKGAKKAILLNVSGPFHSSLMRNAGEMFKIELENVEFKAPSIPVVSNVTGDFEKAPNEIKENLVKQIYSPVLWESSIRKISSLLVQDFYEIGPGKVLKGLMRRIDPSFRVVNIEKPADINLITSNK